MIAQVRGPLVEGWTRGKLLRVSQIPDVLQKRAQRLKPLLSLHIGK